MTQHLIALSLLASTFSSIVTPLASAAPPPPIIEEVSMSQQQFPVGTPLHVVLQDSLTTESAYVGQPVSAFITQDLFIGTKRALSRSDRLLGKVVRVEQPIFGKNAVLKINFNRIWLSKGYSMPIQGQVSTGKENDYWGGETTQGTKIEVVPYHVERIGTYGRIMHTGPRAMGEHVKLTPGTRLVFVLNEPLILDTYQ